MDSAKRKQEVKGMVWVKFKEKFHGQTFVMWKNKKTVAAARKECRNWNQIQNPQEHLSITKTAKKRPKGLRKTPYKGIYKQAKRKR
jgi:hypothetical protein